MDNIQQSKDGIIFEGEILSNGDLKVIERGFVWSGSTDPTLSSPRISQKGINNNSKFILTATFDYRKGEKYKVSAFLRDSMYTVYGKIIEFESLYDTPKPIITGISPNEGRWGDTIEIQGKNFSFFNSSIQVLFGDADAIIYSSNDSSILVKVPDNENKDSVNLNVSVYANSTISDEKFLYIRPEIDDFMPQNGTFNDTITIFGSNFPMYSINCKAEFDGISAQVVMYSDSKIKLLVPLSLAKPESEFSVTISGIKKVFPMRFILNAPVINDFSPVEINMANNTINIYGQNFNPDPALNTVKLGNFNAQVLSASTNEIKAKIPYDIDEGNYSLFLTVGGMTCSGNKEVSFISPWTKKADFGGSARWRAMGFSINNKGYFGLGVSTNSYYSDLNDIWEYDPAENSWSQKNDFKGEPRSYPIYFSVNNCAYVGGGNQGGPMYFDFYKYQESDNWTKISECPLIRVSTAVFSTTDNGYLCDIDEFYKYNPISDTWQHLGNPPASRLEPATFVINGKLYMCTGWDGTKAQNDLWEYDTSTNKWTSKTKLPGDARHRAIGFTLNGKGYIGLGEKTDGSLLKDFWEFDPDTNNWTRVFEFPGDAKRGAACFTLNGKAYIGTGLDKMVQVTNDFWEFDPSK